jgi:CHAD domain-containing protein
MTELERVFQVEPRFPLPDLSGCVPKHGRLVSGAPETERETSLDAADLRLTRAGVQLRFAGGEEAPWRLSLPHVPEEIVRTGLQKRTMTAIPADITALLSVYARGAVPAPLVAVRTTRVRHVLRNRRDAVRAVVVDENVAVLEDRRVLARFRRISVSGTGPRVVERVASALRSGGAIETVLPPTHIQALAALPRFAELAAAPADLTPPNRPSRKATAAEALTAALRTDIGAALHVDPLVRLDVADSVHRMRTAVRRLRSTLTGFAPLFAEGGRSSALGEELRWLGRALGRARDAEVLRDRLASVAGLDPACPLDAASVARIEAELAARYDDARTALDEILTSRRYAVLVDRLIATAAAPAFGADAGRRGDALLPRFVARSWHHLCDGRHGIDGAADLDASSPDRRWHAVRIRARSLRYAVEAVAPVCGSPARALAAGLAELTGVLGAHHDAVLASGAWLDIAASDPDDHALAVTAGRLAERERSAARAAADNYPAAWRALRTDHLTAWLP